VLVTIVLPLLMGRKREGDPARSPPGPIGFLVTIVLLLPMSRKRAGDFVPLAPESAPSEFH
jgi:hypothetical protein